MMNDDKCPNCGYNIKKKSFNGVSCQYCGSINLICKEEDELFLSRMGCLDCNSWLENVKLKGQKDKRSRNTIRK